MKIYISRTVKLNPLVIIVYAIFCYTLAKLAKYGGVSVRLPIIMFTGIMLTLWFLIVIFKKTPKISNPTLTKYAKTWYYFALFLIITITGLTTYDVYQSSINFQGKLSWVIRDLKTTHKVKFRQNNIYEHGIDGILQDIEAKISLPKDLFISNEFSLSFNEEGVIKTIYSSIYGLNEEGETETFLISYDADKDDRISVRLGEYEDLRNPEQEMSLEPFIDAMNILPIQEVVSEWDSDSFDVYYIGERGWGYNTDGIIYYNDNEILGHPEIAYKKIKGYTVSIYLEQNPSVTPKRFVYSNVENLSEAMGALEDVVAPEDRPLEVAEEYHLNHEIGYQLVVLDAALGSRFYGLSKRVEVDGTYELFNEDPFNGSSGVAAGLTFINELVGFAALSHSGGTYADLFRTVDGGKSFEKIELPEVEVALNETETYNPFIFPEMPYLEDGILVMYVNQGANGDYKQGIRAVFHSDDEGLTWEYIREEE